MQARTICAILIGAIVVGGSCATLHAQDTTMTDGEACTVVLSYLSGGFKQKGAYLKNGLKFYGSIIGGEPTPTGIHFLATKSEVSLNYIDVSALKLLPKNDPTKILFEDPHSHVLLNLGIYPLDGRLTEALNRFVSDAHAGHPYDCHIITPAMAAATATKELADFQQKAVAWRAMNPKPPVSDEVTKKRLLAEDAFERKNFGAALDYYKAGIAIDPTWAPGWYNTALISAELKNYSAAALYMKRYLILLPDAPDAAAAKERVLLWEAKAEEASGK